MIGRVVRGRRRVPAAVQGLPRFFAGAGPMKSQWVEPAGAGVGVGPPSEEWAALSGEQEEESRRSMDGGEPAEHRWTTNQYINQLLSQVQVLLFLDQLSSHYRCH